MTQDFHENIIWGGKHAIWPNKIVELFKDGNIKYNIDQPLFLPFCNGREEKWPKVINYITCNIELYRQWAYRHADGDRILLHEIDTYIKDVYNWLKQGRDNDKFDDIESTRLQALKESLTEKLEDYVPERFISGGQESIQRLFNDIQNTEHITRYPCDPSDDWYEGEIERLCLLREKIELLKNLVNKIHPENANKYYYLYYLGEVISEILRYLHVLERNRDELYEKIGKEKIDINKHISKIDDNIEEASGNIQRHYTELKERLVTNEPLEITEIIKAFQQYKISEDISVLPPIRQLYYNLKKYEGKLKQESSKLANAINRLGIELGRGAGYYSIILDILLSDEVLKEMESLNKAESKKKVNKGEEKITSDKMKITPQTQPEYSTPLTMKKWAEILKVPENSMKSIRESGKYHFDKVKDKWRLPKHEIPVEYLEMFRNKIK